MPRAEDHVERLAFAAARTHFNLHLLVQALQKIEQPGAPPFVIFKGWALDSATIGNVGVGNRKIPPLQ